MVFFIFIQIFIGHSVSKQLLLCLCFNVPPTAVLANSEGPDQMLHSVASDLGLYCLLIISISRVLGWHFLFKF